MEKLIRRGAEADIFLVDYHGKQAISKIRHVRTYRHPSLDQALRLKRTVNEAGMLVEAKGLGVPTPLVYYLDPSRAEIVMQLVEGRRLKESLQVDAESSSRLCGIVGENVGKLHVGEIMHGDLTVSNFIESQGKIAFIDFGLSFKSARLEDVATDLHLLKQTLNSYYGEKAHGLFDAVLEGYEHVRGSTHLSKVLKRIGELERRGRYARVV